MDLNLFLCTIRHILARHCWRVHQVLDIWPSHRKYSGQHTRGGTWRARSGRTNRGKDRLLTDHSERNSQCFILGGRRKRLGTGCSNLFSYKLSHYHILIQQVIHLTLYHCPSVPVDIRNLRNPQRFSCDAALTPVPDPFCSWSRTTLWWPDPCSWFRPCCSWVRTDPLASVLLPSLYL